MSNEIIAENYNQVHEPAFDDFNAANMNILSLVFRLLFGTFVSISFIKYINKIKDSCILHSKNAAIEIE